MPLPMALRAGGDLLVEDHKIRVYLKKLLFAAGVSKIEAEIPRR